MEKKTYQPGDELTLEIFKGNSGKPMSKTETGMCCFFNEFMAIGATYICRIDQVFERFVFCSPLIKIRTAKENDRLIESRISVFAKEKHKRIKVKRSYKFMSNQQKQQ